jgi:hypothetical protein
MRMKEDDKSVHILVYEERKVLGQGRVHQTVGSAN